MAKQKTDWKGVVSRVLKLEGQAILSCQNRLESEGSSSQAMQKALEILNQTLDNKGKIIVTGVGKSGKVGQKIAATLCSTGSLAIYLHPTEGLHGDLGVLTSLDCVLALSYSGNSEELIRLMPSFKARKIPVIGMGGNPVSALARESDAFIDASIEQEACPHNLAPTTSTTLMLALGDALSVALMEMRGFNAQSFAENHPGGSLGKRLHLTLGEMMHQGESLAVCDSKTPMDQVIALSTQKRLGIVLVTQGKNLLGIVTDGDIRRALSHREKFFSLTAAEVMTKNPTTATTEMLAYDALQLMENRPHQIKELPIVNSKNEYQGVVRLHDLVRIL